MSTTHTTTRAAFTLREVAESYGISVGTVRREINRGNLTAHKLAGRVVVMTPDLERWVSGSIVEVAP